MNTAGFHLAEMHSAVPSGASGSTGVFSPKHIPGGAVVAEPVTLRDLPATVLDLLGLREPGAVSWKLPAFAVDIGKGFDERAKVGALVRSKYSRRRSDVVRGGARRHEVHHRRDTPLHQERGWA